MSELDLSPTDDAVEDYYDQLEAYERVGAQHEGAVRTAFRDLLSHGGTQMGWELVPEWSPQDRRIRIDGALLDEYRLTHGFWEAKDSDDDLDREIQKKLDKGYPADNTIFQAPNRAVLMQDGGITFDADIRDPQTLVDLLKLFFDYEKPAHEEWEHAVAEFKDRVPELGRAVREVIEEEFEQNDKFREAFQNFFALCQQAINPNLSREAVEEMLIQHLLTERLFRTVFNNPDFVRRNVIAREIETVIDALTSRSFSRQEFLQRLDRFYKAIEEAADAAAGFGEKQEFLNTVYEQFFQGFAVDKADTHGIVYTPQPIVDYMVNSVAGLVEEHFGQSLAGDNVQVLDPFVGTGNFIVRAMQELPTRRLKDKYGASGEEPDLHANEVMLLPYYVASMNVEHAYYERTGTYAPYEGICLVDTFEIEDQKQRPKLFTPENTERVTRQQEQPLKVILGNPPYNAWLNANDNNRNRTYEHVDDRVRSTYSADSSATNKNALSDPYVKAIRWATDRIEDEGIVAFVTNNSFVDSLAFDGVRKHLEKDFSTIYHLNLRGNARTSGERRKREAGNVFNDQIRVGVGITFFIKRANDSDEPATIFYHEADDYLRSAEKQELLKKAGDWRGIEWEELAPDDKHRWLVDPQTKEFESYVAIGSKDAKKAERGEAETIFKMYCRGAETTRDAWVYDFDSEALHERVKSFIEVYNSEVRRWENREDRQASPRDFVLDDDTTIKWSSSLRRDLKAGRTANFSSDRVRSALYRPFTKMDLFYDQRLVHRPGYFSNFFPTAEAEEENRTICVTDKGSDKPFMTLMTDAIPDLHVTGAATSAQCFPFYVYDEDGTNRRENVTDWALEQVQTHYGDSSITKWDIFYYVYALLHHPRYRERYEGPLSRHLPHLPYAPDFAAFAEAGEQLADLHVGYEDVEPYPLDENESGQLEWHVEKMQWRQNKTALKYNDFLTLEGIPKKAHDYQLAHKSALGWLKSRYRIKTYSRYDITHDPNDPDNKWYIVDLIKRMTTVSVETVDIIENLPDLGLPETE
jgi:predicted helicase